MAIDLTQNPEQSLLKLSGELSIYDAAELKDALLYGLLASPVLEVDLSAVQAMDTCVLQVLIAAKHQAQRKGHSLQLVNHSAAMLELLELSGLAAFFGDPVLLTDA